jgi:drebrin-like protein
VVKSSGSNGFEGLKNYLEEDAVCYALMRVVDEYEGIPTLKYAFITFVGEKVSIMKKAKISTQ